MTVPSVPPPVTNEQVIICVNNVVVLPALRWWKDVPKNDPLHMRLMLHLTNQHTSQCSLQSIHSLLWMLTVTTFTSETCFGNDGKHRSSWKAQQSLKYCHPH
jgi:hypothetical protein